MTTSPPLENPCPYELKFGYFDDILDQSSHVASCRLVWEHWTNTWVTDILFLLIIFVDTTEDGSNNYFSVPNKGTLVDVIIEVPSFLLRNDT